MKLIAIFAQVRIRGLSASGTVAALAAGAACLAAGWTWLIMLLAFYMSSTLLSRFHTDAKRERAGDVVEKGGDRDMWQVAANGGVFTVLAVASTVTHSPVFFGAGAGAIAASAADTWATEIGLLSRRMPRSIFSMQRVPPGTSGGVTLAGLAGSFAGSAFIAIAAVLLDWPSSASIAALIGGLGGSLADSLLGATVQSRRSCPACGVGTERAVHGCGTTTLRAGGFNWMRNDLVNFFCSLTGAFLGYLIAA